MEFLDSNFLISLGSMAVLAALAGTFYRRCIREGVQLRAAVRRKAEFMSGNEREFFERLSRALPEFHVFPQVSMAALLTPSVPAGHPQYWRVREQFGQKICDYVVCDRRSLAPVLVVELDDRMHDFAKDAARDDVVAKAGLKTLRFWSRNKPVQAQIRRRVAELLGPALGFRP